MVPTNYSRLVLAMLTSLAACVASDNSQESAFRQVKTVSTVITTDVVYTPAMMILGKDDGDIVRCPHATPTSCEVYHSGDSAVSAVLVHGEFLFAALQSGVMLRCVWQRKHSCSIFYEAHSGMSGLAVSAGQVYAGLENGTVLRCSMNTPNSCWSFTELGRNITSLAASDGFIYVGAPNGRIDRCDTAGNNCSIICEYSGSSITGLKVTGGKVFGLRHGGYIQSGDGVSGECKSFTIIGGPYVDMAAYSGELYMVRKDVQEIRINVPGDQETRVFASHQGASSIAFAYSTYAMQEKYRAESVKCIWRGVFTCPPTVFYYDDLLHRAALEVFVKDGKIFDSQGKPVDTSAADESHSQRAAIFVMGPDGQLLLSNVHKRGLLHTSSLLAGSPVSGAGLMQVERGRIVSITSCSVHYRPDSDLNEQVKKALRMKGYTDQIDFRPCSYNDMLCVVD